MAREGFSEKFSIKVEDMNVDGFELKGGSQKDEPKNVFSAAELYHDGKELGCHIFWNRCTGFPPMVKWLNSAKKEDKSEYVRGDNIAQAVKEPLDALWTKKFGKSPWEFQKPQSTQQQAAQDKPKKTDDNEIINDAASVLAGIFDDDDVVYDEEFEEPMVSLPNVGRCGSDDPKIVIANSKQAITKAERAGCNAQLVARLRNGISNGAINEVFIEDNVIKVVCGDRLFYGDPVTGEVKKFG